MAPALRIPCADFELRRFELGDGPGLSVAVADSLVELRPWMPWAHSEPLAPGRRTALIESWLRDWATDAAYHYGLFKDGAVIGAAALHAIGPGALEIGYWVRTCETRHGRATAAAGALTAAAFGLEDIDRVEIHHDAANVASGRVPEKLGFTRVEERPYKGDAPGDTGILVVWNVARADWS